MPVAVVIGPRHAQGTETPGGELADRPGDLGADLVLVGRQIEDDLRRTLRDLELTPVRSSDLGLRAFMDRVERLEVQDLVTLDGLTVLESAEHRQVDRVLVLGARGQRRLEDHLLGGGSGDREWVAQCQLVLRQRAGLV